MGGISYHPDKKSCIAAAKAAGYTVVATSHSEDGKGRSGDYAHGSRLYFAKPNSVRNDFGIEMEHCTCSRLKMGWALSTFDAPTTGPNVPGASDRSAFAHRIGKYVEENYGISDGADLAYNYLCSSQIKMDDSLESAASYVAQSIEQA